MRFVGVLALALVIAGPAHAATVPQLGAPPVQGDCFVLGLPEGTKCYYGVSGVTFSNSPHILRVGEKMTVNVTSGWDSFVGQNGPVVRTVTNTLNIGGGLIYDGDPCDASHIFSFSDSCTLVATIAGGGWRTHGYTLSIVGSNPYEAGDYYAIVGPDTYEIAGTLRKHNPASNAQEPVAGVTVVVEEIGGDGDVYSQISNLNGRYSVLVDRGTWRIRTGDRRLCHETPSGSGCARTPQTSTPGDRQVNFSMPLPVKVSGTVLTKDGLPVAGAKLRLRAAGDTPRETLSAKDGTYAFEDVTPGTPVTLDSTQAGVCPKSAAVAEILPNGKCKEPALTVTPERDVTVNFEKPGCVTALDFRTSMVAKGECFQLEGPDHWTTDKPFRMNGLDFEPGGTVDFDGTSRTVWFKSGLTTVWLPGPKASIPIGVLPPVVSSATFAAPTVQFSQGAGFGDAAGLGAKVAEAIGGFPLSGKVSVVMTAGKSLVNGNLTFPVDPGVQYSWKTGGFKQPNGDSAQSFGVGFVATADMDYGWRAFEVNIADGFSSPLFTLRSAKASYDVPSEVWTIGGSIEPEWLKPSRSALNAAPVDSDVPGGSISGSVSATGIPAFGGSFTGMTAAIDGLNLPINGAAFLQRLRMGIAMQSLQAGMPFVMTAGVGLSLGPRLAPKVVNLPLLGPIPLQPAERASIDGDFTVSWSRLALDGDNDVSISGTAAVKVWDQQVALGTISLYPAQGLFGGSLNLGISDPSGGTLFSLRGRGEVWIDGRANRYGRIYVEGSGNVSIAGLGGNGDIVITGPDPLKAGACVEYFGYRVGLAYNYDTGEWQSGEACDLSGYRALKPVPPKPAKAAAKASIRTFRAAGDEGLLSFEVPVARGTVTLTGPGVRLTSAASKGTRRGTAMALPNPARKSVTFMVGKPRAGKYTVRGTGLGTMRFARPLSEPQIDGELDASRCSPVLTWRAAGVEGHTLRFVEKSANGAVRVLGESTKAKGSLTITPMPSGGRSEVAAEVLNGATVRATIPLGTYSSRVGPSIPGPRSVAVRTAPKGKARVSWPAVCGAEAYAVRVGPGRDTIVTGLSTTVARAKQASTVTVTALGRGREPGGSTLVPLPKR